MPTLNEYSPDNEKEGYFVRANVGGNHPITLQVSTIASRIFKALDYDDGDAVPTKLVWSMFDFDMLYTLSSVDVESSTPDIDPSEVFRELDLDNKLSDEERAELVSYLEAYDGPDADRINKLREELIEDLTQAELEGNDIEGESWFPNFYKLPKSTEEVKQTLIDWSPEDMVERSRKALLLNEQFVKWSVRTLATHDALDETPIVSIENKRMKYRLNPPNGNEKLTVTDCRGHKDRVSRKGIRDCEYDYFIRRVLSDGTVEKAYIYKDMIVKYDSYNGDGGSITLLKFDLDDILPPNRSYFGGTDDEPYRANRLVEDHLNKPIDRIQKEKPYSTRSEDNTDGNDDSNNDSDTNSSNQISSKMTDAVSRLPNTELLTVKALSNSNNPKLYVNENQLVVVTADIPVEKGDRVVVELPQNYQNHMITSKAVKASNIPEENPKKWIELNI
jgi:hypothetical protein